MMSYTLIMNGVEGMTIQCPYCWEMIEISVDCSVTSQEYVEDCQVCCQPILMKVELSAQGIPNVAVSREN